MPSTATACAIRTFTCSDHYVCHYRHYSPDRPAKGDVVFLHGIQSHGGWYECSCGKLREAGYAVWFLDRRGSGLNREARGDTPSFERLLDDVAEFLRTFAVGGVATRRRIPLFLGGISWGGKLAVGLQRHQPGLTDGLLLLCPGFYPQVKLPLNEQLAVFRKRTQLVPIPLDDPDLFTATPRWREFIRHDPLAL